MQDTLVTIGKVHLDYSLYPGEDFYCDGAVEEELLEIAGKVPESEFEKVIAERKDWPTLYHFSPVRADIVDWIPFTGHEKVLEIGAGLGAVTGKLAEKCGEVVCVDLSSKRSRINALRHKDADNLCIHVGNFADIEPTLDRDFDYIFLIGVFEYAGSYISGAAPFDEELRRLLSHRKAGGRVVIAIENRLGMKYFAGCREDHSGRYFDGITGYTGGKSPAETFSRPALEKIFRRNGEEEFSFYYPYPDYKLMHTLYSDRKLPAGPELSDNIRNFDRDRLLLFEEKEALTAAAEDGLFPVFANSYLVVLGPQLPVIYAKYSVDRAPEYRIVTTISEDGGKRCVEKHAAVPQADRHILHLAEAARGLEKRYHGTELAVCPVEIRDGRAYFPFLKGRNLESLLDEKLFSGDEEGFLALIVKFRDCVSAGEDCAFSDPDMIFGNIIVDKDGNFTAIDYEWASEGRIPGEEILARALTVYLQADERREIKCGGILEKTFGISERALRDAGQAEEEFQKKVMGNTVSMAEIRSAIGNRVLIPGELIEEDDRLKEKARRAEMEKWADRSDRPLSSIQIYTDTGAGFREEESFFDPEYYGDEGRRVLTLEVGPEVNKLRVDPALCPCFVLLREVKCGENVLNRTARFMRTDGKKGPGGEYVFATSDPWFCFDMNRVRKITHADRGQKVTLTLELQMIGMPSTMAEVLLKGKGI